MCLILEFTESGRRHWADDVAALSFTVRRVLLAFYAFCKAKCFWVDWLTVWLSMSRWVKVNSARCNAPSRRRVCYHRLFDFYTFCHIYFHLLMNCHHHYCVLSFLIYYLLFVRPTVVFVTLFSGFEIIMPWKEINYLFLNYF